MVGPDPRLLGFLSAEKSSGLGLQNSQPRPELQGLGKATLLIWPPDDPVFSYDRARRLTEMLPDARLVDVEDSRGFVSEDQPKRLAEEIAHFMGEIERTI